MVCGGWVIVDGGERETRYAPLMAFIFQDNARDGRVCSMIGMIKIRDKIGARDERQRDDHLGA